MTIRSTLATSLLFALLITPLAAAAQDAAPPRAIRRDVPITNAIRRAFEAGTRDSTGAPGADYWQLQTDFTIDVRLDPETQTLTGEERVVIHNNSTSDLSDILLRLDHNIFRPRVPRGSSVPAETTEGMVVTRVAVDGQTVDAQVTTPALLVDGLELVVERGENERLPILDHPLRR